MNSTTPLVSILMPAYNAEAWIGDTIESALAQTWPHTEVIVVDDGSTDGTAAIAESFTDRGVRLVRQSNQGQSAAENRAFRESRGAFIQYLDADDLLGPEKVAIQMARLERNPGCVASGEWARFYQSPGEAVFEPEPVWRDLDAIEWLIQSWTGGGGMMQAAIWLIPRPVLESAGRWDERLSLINDFEFFTRVLLASDGVRFCAGARLYYRSGLAGSLSQVRSDRAWASAWLSLDLGTRALLARTDRVDARRACADLFQQLAYEAHAVEPDLAVRAEARAIELGGSTAAMDGGMLFRSLRRALGWKAAKRIKRAAYRLGYGRVTAARAGVARAQGRR